jgi:hypothetical protein
MVLRIYIHVWWFFILICGPIWVLGQVCISTSYCFCGVQWLRISQSQGYTSFGASLPLKNYMEGKVSKKKNKRLFPLTSFVPCSLYWISWRVKLGSIGCPETLVRNYHSTVCSISEECRSHWWLMIWWCWHWFDLHGLFKNDPVSRSALHCFIRKFQTALHI